MLHHSVTSKARKTRLGIGVHRLVYFAQQGNIRKSRSMEAVNDESEYGGLPEFKTDHKKLDTKSRSLPSSSRNITVVRNEYGGLPAVLKKEEPKSKVEQEDNYWGLPVSKDPKSYQADNNYTGLPIIKDAKKVSYHEDEDNYTGLPVMKGNRNTYTTDSKKYDPKLEYCGLPVPKLPQLAYEEENHYAGLPILAMSKSPVKSPIKVTQSPPSPRRTDVFLSVQASKGHSSMTDSYKDDENGEENPYGSLPTYEEEENPYGSLPSFKVKT